MYVDLPGIKRLDPDYEYFRSVTKAVSIIRNGLIASAAGDHGAIDFYIDDDGNYRCALHRHRITEDDKIFKKQKEAISWLKDNLASIY